MCRRWGSKPIPRKNNAKRQKGNINNYRYADDTTLMAEREEELKSLLMKLTEESEKAGSVKLLILEIQFIVACPSYIWPP